jgi:HEPN domain-containing protein
MTLENLGISYFRKAQSRLKILPVLLEDENYSDVVRESQEVVELALKGALRVVGVEPPKIHDVGPLIIEHIGKLPDSVSVNAGRLAGISKWLRKEREFSFYGDVDLIPTEEYTRADADRAIEDARFTVACVAGLFS